MSIPLAGEPPTGVASTVELEVVPVPGEDEEENNRGSYTVTFAPAPE